MFTHPFFLPHFFLDKMFLVLLLIGILNVNGEDTPIACYNPGPMPHGGSFIVCVGQSFCIENPMYGPNYVAANGNCVCPSGTAGKSCSSDTDCCHNQIGCNTSTKTCNCISSNNIIVHPDCTNCCHGCEYWSWPYYAYYCKT